MRVATRYEISINCPQFDFTTFPFDDQNCSIVLRSSSTHQNISIINEYNNKVVLYEDFDFRRLNLQYDVSFGEFASVDAQDSTSFLGTTLKFRRHTAPFAM